MLLVSSHCRPGSRLHAPASATALVLPRPSLIGGRFALQYNGLVIILGAQPARRSHHFSDLNFRAICVTIL